MENLKYMKKTPSEDSRVSHSEADSSAGDSDDDSQIRAYVSEFKNEVERKHAASKTNAKYRFPRKTVQKDLTVRVKGDSCESLNDVTFYDLDSQNVKHELTNPLNPNRGSESDFLVDVIKRLGKLDHRYLASQMRNNRSPFFKILYSSIQRKVAKDRKSSRRDSSLVTCKPQ